MSTLLYAARTRQRQAGVSTVSQTPATPGSSTWLDALVALVPSEVLVIHAIAIAAGTKTLEPPSGTDDGAITIITRPGLLKASFFVLIALAVFLYFIRKKDSWDNLDLARMLIPPSAFVTWTLVQQNTALDAVVTGLDEGIRAVLGATLAVVLATSAKRLTP